MTKNDVINFFRGLPAAEPEQFNRALEMYRKSPAHNAGLVRQYNASGYSKTSLANLLYDLQQLWGIKDVEKLPVKKKEDPNLIVSLAIKNSKNQKALYALKREFDHPDVILLNATDALKNFDLECFTALIDLIASIKKEYNIEDDLEIDLISDIIKDVITEVKLPEEFEKELLELEKYDLTGPLPVINSISDIKFRDEYPFLKLESCPAELKILATDKITAYNMYQLKHALLEEIAEGKLKVTEDEKTEIAATAVEIYEEGEAIKAELDYYRDNNKVLGKHPVFAELALKREIDSMSIEECHKEIKNAAPYISKKKKAIAKAKSEEEKAKLQAELKAREEKLKKVKEKLGLQ